MGEESMSKKTVQKSKKRTTIANKKRTTGVKANTVVRSASVTSEKVTEVKPVEVPKKVDIVESTPKTTVQPKETSEKVVAAESAPAVKTAPAKKATTKKTTTAKSTTATSKKTTTAKPKSVKSETPVEAKPTEVIQEVPVEKSQPIDLGPRRSVAFIGSECYPFVKTGGLGDVMSALPKSLAKLNMDVKVIIPRYKCIPQKFQEKMEYKGSFYMDLCADGKQYYVGIMEYQEDGVVYDFIDNDEFFSWGNPYTNLIDDIPKFCYFSKAALAALNYLNWTPDIVHIHCPNGYILDLFKTLQFLAESNTKVVLTNHAEYWYTGGCGYSYLCSKFQNKCFKCNVVKGLLGLDAANVEWENFRNAYQHFDRDNIIVTSVSPWVESRARKSSSMEGLTQTTVLNGIDTRIFRVRNISKETLSKLPNNKPIALHVTAEFTTNKDSIKGGFWIKKLAEFNPDVNFVVACTFTGVIEDLPSNLFIWGRTKSQEELAELYNAAKITVLTSKKETFSMIVAESLCCGTPIIGFKAGGPESISIEDYSFFYDQGNIYDLNDGLIEKLNMKEGIKEIISDIAITKYDKNVMVNNYVELYNKLLSDNH